MQDELVVHMPKWIIIRLGDSVDLTTHGGTKRLPTRARPVAVYTHGMQPRHSVFEIGFSGKAVS